jgi:hypothetical protein
MFSRAFARSSSGRRHAADIAKINVIRDRALRPHVNKEWLAMFPDPHSRPARHTFPAPDLPPDMLVQCEVIAFMG